MLKRLVAERTLDLREKGPISGAAGAPFVLDLLERVDSMVDIET